MVTAEKSRVCRPSRSERPTLECSKTEVNDPFAHVIRLRRLGGAAMAGIRVDFKTDISERAPEGQSFEHQDVVSYGEFGWESSAGFYLEEVLDNGVAMAQDEAKYLGSDYMVQREETFRSQLGMIDQWIEGGAEGYLMFNSLAPSDSEVPTALAKKMRFKIDRLMSSNAVYSYNDGKLHVTYFSLDQHTLQAQQQLLEHLGCIDEVSATTLQELSVPHVFATDEDPIDLIKTHFAQSRATDIEGHNLETAFGKYQNVLQEVDISESQGFVSAGLNELATELGYELATRQHFNTEDARRLLDVLRSNSFPHFIYSGLKKSVQTSIGGSSKEAIRSGASYDGLCPTSAKPGAESSAVVGYLDRVGNITVGDCMMKDCPSAKEVLVSVGGCGYCLLYCQPQFDDGLNDIQIAAQYQKKAADKAREQIIAKNREKVAYNKRSQAKAKTKKSTFSFWDVLF